ncbi:arginyltransferase [Corallincola platygyrae]|uniref:Aspartate/glutamate leucyltransferase n=1 Tax=Corallincola platygyrae TaxID=1193278 RepID=A0ABW4XGM7_9GAMM
MPESISVRLGITQTIPCQYIDGEFERLVVLAAEEIADDFKYRHLLAHGFRRCGDSLYAPHCPECKACVPIRIPVQDFKPSRSQRRVLNAGDRALTIEVIDQLDRSAVYPLYKRYVEIRHAESSMNPVSYEQYENFLFSHWHQPKYLCLYDEKTLVGIAVTDYLEDSLSAVYTFFEPEYDKLSLGTYALLKQIEFAKSEQKPFLYLGFQIDKCAAMNYKTRYKPYQMLENGHWNQYE